MLTILFGMIILTTKLFPETPTGAWMHRNFVERPVEGLSKVERKHIIFLFVGLFLIQAFTLVATADLAVLAAWDVTVYIDVAAAVWVGVAFARTKAAWTFVKIQMLRVLSKGTSNGRREIKTKAIQRDADTGASNDDEDRPGRVALAA